MARPTLYSHRKFLKLCRLIGSAPRALGCLEFLWAACYESGCPDIGQSVDAEALARWDGKPGELTAALLSSGFIEKNRSQYVIHDFWHHVPEYVRKRYKREQMRRNSDQSVSGQRPDSDRTLTSTHTRTRETPAPALARALTTRARGAVEVESVAREDGPEGPGAHPPGNGSEEIPLRSDVVKRVVRRLDAREARAAGTASLAPVAAPETAWPAENHQAYTEGVGQLRQLVRPAEPGEDLEDRIARLLKAEPGRLG